MMGIDSGGTEQADAHPLETGFSQMMQVVTVPCHEVKGQAGMGGHGLPKFLDEFGIECPYFCFGKGNPKMEIGSIGEINRHMDQGLIHGKGPRGIAGNTGGDGQRLTKRHAKADPHIFGGMMIIHLGIPRGGDG